MSRILEICDKLIWMFRMDALDKRWSFGWHGWSLGLWTVSGVLGFGLRHMDWTGKRMLLNTSRAAVIGVWSLLELCNAALRFTKL